MSVADILQVLQVRGARLYVADGRLKYAGPRRPENDPLRTAIAAHRNELLCLLSDPQPSMQPAGWSDRLGREVYEHGARPGTWIETETSLALCIWCPAPLAEGDRLGCEQHRTPPLVTDDVDQQAVSVTSAPAIGRDDLLILAELRGWKGLPLGPGVSAGGTEAMWRTFTACVQPAQLRTAVSAAWERWGDTIAVLAADAGARQESAA